MLALVARLTVKKGLERNFEETMKGVVPKVRQEPGNLAYNMCRIKDDPRVFVFYEEYRDEAAFSAHRKHLKELGVDLASMLDGPPVLEFMEKLAG
jgi:quinol monooxygenase YgiN